MSTNIHLRPTQTSICPIILTYCKVLFSIDMPVNMDFSSADANLFLYDNDDPLNDYECAPRTVSVSQVENRNLELPSLFFHVTSEEEGMKESNTNIHDTSSDVCADLATAIKSSIHKKQGYFAVHVHSSLINASVKYITLNITLKLDECWKKVETLVIQSTPIRYVFIYIYVVFIYMLIFSRAAVSK